MKYWDEKNKKLMTAAEKAEKEVAEREAEKKDENTEIVLESAEEEAVMMDFGGTESAAGIKTTKRVKK